MFETDFEIEAEDAKVSDLSKLSSAELMREILSAEVQPACDSRTIGLKPQYKLPRASQSNQEALIQMEGVRVRYGDRVVLGDWTYGKQRKAKSEEEDQEKQKSGLWWTVRRGERWGLFGPNGE